MSSNSQLTVVVHALAWAAAHEAQGGEWTTSEQIAGSVRTNPAVIRRLLSPLVRAGLLESRRGPGSGWRLARPAGEISLWAVEEALGAEGAFAMHRNEPSPNCPIAHGIRAALAPVYARVDDAVRHTLEMTSVADVLDASLRV